MPVQMYLFANLKEMVLVTIFRQRHCCASKIFADWRTDGFHNQGGFAAAVLAQQEHPKNDC